MNDFTREEIRATDKFPSSEVRARPGEGAPGAATGAPLPRRRPLCAPRRRGRPPAGPPPARAVAPRRAAGCDRWRQLPRSPQPGGRPPRQSTAPPSRGPDDDGAAQRGGAFFKPTNYNESLTRAPAAAAQGGRRDGRRRGARVAQDPDRVRQDGAFYLLSEEPEEGRRQALRLPGKPRAAAAVARSGGLTRSRRRASPRTRRSRTRRARSSRRAPFASGECCRHCDRPRAGRGRAED